MQSSHGKPNVALIIGGLVLAFFLGLGAMVAFGRGTEMRSKAAYSPAEECSKLCKRFGPQAGTCQARCSKVTTGEMTCSEACSFLKGDNQQRCTNVCTSKIAQGGAVNPAPTAGGTPGAIAPPEKCTNVCRGLPQKFQTMCSEKCGQVVAGTASCSQACGSFEKNANAICLSRCMSIVGKDQSTGCNSVCRGLQGGMQEKCSGACTKVQNGQASCSEACAEFPETHRQQCMTRCQKIDVVTPPPPSTQ